ncbi:neuromedin-U receptor 1-like [Amphiura filiformis]|uniref:neuromedin-U receptor 1-like n=1 Tax=Amphiura filiformis TaxID=82378 RepID=UPI003B21B5F1
MFLLFRNGYGIALAKKSSINRSYPVDSPFGCAMWVITTRLFCMVSVMFTTIITIERYLAICHPLKHMMMKGKKRNVKLIAFIWVFGFFAALSIAPRFAANKTYCLLWPDTEEYNNMPMLFHTCSQHKSFPHAGAYEGILIMFVLILAMIFNSVLFYLIIRALNERSKSELRGAGQQQNQANIEIDRVRNQVARTLVANGIIFYLCQIPYRVYSLDDIADELHLDIAFLDDQQEVTVLNIGRLFLLLNSSINPYLYLVGCRHYREAFWKTFCYSREVSENKNSSTGKSLETGMDSGI